MHKIPDIIKQTARDLRKNMTNSEKILWKELKARKFFGFKILRQSPLYVYTENTGLDRYIIPDFICYEKRVIIEVDGSIHNNSEIINLDEEKEALVKKIGFKVLRITNEDIEDSLKDILEVIKTELT